MSLRPERFSLPYPSLLVSIILSATCMGLVIPYARTLPLVFGSIVFTLTYHSLFLVSTFVNGNPGDRPHISPLEHPHTVWIFVIPLFWLAIVIHGIAIVTSGSTSDADIGLVIFAGLEFVLTTYIAYVCGKGLRKERARWKSDLEATLESIRNFRQLEGDLFFFGSASYSDG